MFALLAVITAVGNSPTEHDIWAQVSHCGFTFNVDARPAGSSVILGSDRHTLFVEKGPSEARKRDCLVSWAERHGLKVKYGRLAK